MNTGLFQFIRSIINDRDNPINDIGKYIFDLDEVDILHEINVCERRVWVGSCPTAVSTHGACFGVTIPMEMAEGTISAIILTDAFYDRMDKDGKNFIYMHEIGHIVNGDIDKAVELSKQYAAATESATELQQVLNMRKLMLSNRAIDEEFAADEYAANNIGYSQAINGLSQLLIAPRWAISKDSKKEIRRRIAHLELRRDQLRKEASYHVA